MKLVDLSLLLGSCEIRPWRVIPAVGVFWVATEDHDYREVAVANALFIVAVAAVDALFSVAVGAGPRWRAALGRLGWLSLGAAAEKF